MPQAADPNLTPNPSPTPSPTPSPNPNPSPNPSPSPSPSPNPNPTRTRTRTPTPNPNTTPSLWQTADATKRNFDLLVSAWEAEAAGPRKSYASSSP